MVFNQQNLFMVYENENFWNTSTLIHSKAVTILAALNQAGKDDRLRVIAALLTRECPSKTSSFSIKLWIPPLASYLIKWMDNVGVWVWDILEFHDGNYVPEHVYMHGYSKVHTLHAKNELGLSCLTIVHLVELSFAFELPMEKISTLNLRP